MSTSTPLTDPSSKPALKKPRRWLRRLSWALVGILLLIAISHRWIFFGLVDLGIRSIEKKGHMQITYQLNGTIFTSLELTKVKVRVLESGPLKKLTLEKLALRYHPWAGLTKGLPALIESVEVRDLDLMLDATKKQPPKKQRMSNRKFSLPFPQLVDIRGVRVRVQTPGGLLDVDNASLTLLPDRAGTLSLDRIIIPNYRTFDQLHAVTSYQNRDLILQNLTITPDLVIQRLQVNASKLGEQQLTAQLAAQSFGGTLAMDFSMLDLGQTNDMTISLSANKIDLKGLTGFLSPASTTSGILEQVNLRITGFADDLATWNGGLKVQLSNPVFAKMAFDTGAVNAVIHEGQLIFSDTALLRGEQWVTLSGNMHLPGKDVIAHPFKANVGLSANIPDFSSLIPEASGSANLNAAIKVSPQHFNANLTSHITAFGLHNITLDTAQATASFSKSSPTVIDWKQPWWKNSQSTTNITSSILKVNDYTFDNVGAVLKSTNQKAIIESIEIVRGQNSIRSQGTFTFLEKPTSSLPGVLDLTLEVVGPSLQEFSIDAENPVIAGQINGNGSLRWETAQPEGKLNLQATDLLHQGVKLGTLVIDATANNGVAKLNNILLDMPGTSFIQATGEFDLITRNHYAAQISSRLTDLSQFKPLLGKGLAATPLGGTIELNWNGTGELVKRLHEGRLSLFAKEGVYAGVSGIRLSTDGYYTPTEASFPNIDLNTNKGSLVTSLTYLNKVLSISNLKLSQNKELRLAGNIAFPLDLEQIANSEKRFPLDSPIGIDLIGKDIQLGGLFSDMGLIPPATGMISLDTKAKGTLRNLDALIALKLNGIKTEKAKQIRPVDAEVNIAIADQRANLSGSIREPSLNPIILSGSIPLDLASIISTGSINPKLPIQFKASLPPSSLAFLNLYVGALRDVTGTLGLDVNMEGTLEKPVFQGGIIADVQSVRFRSDSLPTIRNIGINLGFRENLLTFNQFKGDLAGGPFTAGGTINLTKPAEPILDLKLQGRSILIVRNDSVVVRSDLDLAVKGPLNAADVSGTVGVTDSRFFREIDILPIKLPGRPAPAIPDKRPNLSFPNPPLRDWKFNIDIKTLDSFRITGNLANGEVIVGLNLSGTGLAPTLEGNVQISNLKASLPFSRLNIDSGNIYFSKNLPPLNPILDLRGYSKVRDYEITAYIWGDLVKPQTLFLSQPPLTQEDILTLLATGVTQSEIAENPQLLAGRAGWLFIQKYYNRIFRRKQSFEQDSLADRLDVQIGNVDPKTGRESASARLRLSDRWQIIGDLDLTGGVRGQVRYLLRFK